MSSDDSVTGWIARLKTGDERAARKLWERYFGPLLDLARFRLLGHSRRVTDEEDIALSAFHSFYQAVLNDRYPRLQDRDDLWQLLVMHTTRKAVDQKRYQHRRKRTASPAGSEAIPSLDQLADNEPDPQIAAQLAEQFHWLLDQLGEADLQLIAVRKLEGHADEEVAQELVCSRRTVVRKLAVIRAVWRELLEAE